MIRNLASTMRSSTNKGRLTNCRASFVAIGRCVSSSVDMGSCRPELREPLPIQVFSTRHMGPPCAVDDDPS